MFVALLITKSKKAYRREARYQTRTYSMKDLVMIQNVKTTRGYFEKLGLAEIEQRGKKWFFVVCQDAVMVPQLYKKVVGVPSEILLSPPIRFSGVASKEGKCEKTGVFQLYNKLETNNNLQSEREKNGNFD